MHNKNRLILLGICVLLASILRVFVFINTDHLDGESVFRIMDSYSLASEPFKTLTICSTSGSGGQKMYYFLNSLLMHFIDEPIFIARITSLIFGIFTIIPYYLLIRLVFSREIALASVLALAFYSVHIQLSAVSMANAGAIFFVILAVYFLIQYLSADNSRKSKVYFAASIIFTILATSFRLEGLFLIIIIPLLVLQRKGFRQAGLFLVFSCLYLLYTVYIFSCSGNPFGFLGSLPQGPEHFSFLVTYSGSDMPDYYNKHQCLVWVITLFRTFSYPLSILGFLGMIAGFKDKQQSILFFIFLGFFLFLTAHQINHNHPPYARYSAIFAIFFIPFIFSGINKIIGYICRLLSIKIFHKRILTLSLMAVATFYFAFFSVNLLIKKIPEMQYERRIDNLIAWWGKNINSGDLLIRSFDNSITGAAMISNKFIGSGYSPEIPILSTRKIKALAQNGNLRLQLEHLMDAFAHFHGSISTVLTKRNQAPAIKRIVFMLDEAGYAYLKDNFPALIKEIEIKKTGFFYFGVLSLM